MADIESMYYQVRVPEYQQTFIKFLCWENHNIEEKPLDFATCAHVSGGVSWASCSNYTLKRTATDNTDQFGQEAAEVVRRNFYVADLLKSADDPKTAIILVKNVVDMCKSGGFHLKNLSPTTGNCWFLFLKIKEEMVSRPDWWSPNWKGFRYSVEYSWWLFHF